MKNTTEIFESLKFYFNLRNDSALAEFLDVDRGTFSGWKKRNTFNIELLVSKLENTDINLHWLLTGAGNPKIAKLSEYDYSQGIEQYPTILSENITKYGDVPDKDFDKLKRENLILKTKLEYAEEMLNRILKK